ncbi:hypothetical protein QFC21_006313 [Naganishia friedmannii]|uniref:Uncharacterized protein n=1 Tax=Naganishia friedmannii TaxID=89922 RepID=A0ACC2V3X4_9TREE|nr:hypothetical protein QFC21_006313 [Naganishia friedmannii]
MPGNIELIDDQAQMIRQPGGGTKTFTWEVMPEIFWDAHLALEKYWNDRVVNAHVKLKIIQHVATAMPYDSMTEAMVKRLDESDQIAINTLLVFNARRLYTPGITLSVASERTEAEKRQEEEGVDGLIDRLPSPSSTFAIGNCLGQKRLRLLSVSGLVFVMIAQGRVGMERGGV